MTMLPRVASMRHGFLITAAPISTMVEVVVVARAHGGSSRCIILCCGAWGQTNTWSKRKLAKKCGESELLNFQFMDYTISSGYRKDQRLHRQGSLCSVCTLKYTFVIKLEQFDQDMRELCHQLEVNRKETWAVVVTVHTQTQR